MPYSVYLSCHFLDSAVESGSAEESLDQIGFEDAEPGRHVVIAHAHQSYGYGWLHMRRPCDIEAIVKAL